MKVQSDKDKLKTIQREQSLQEEEGPTLDDFEDPVIIPSLVDKYGSLESTH